MEARDVTKEEQQHVITSINKANESSSTVMASEHCFNGGNGDIKGSSSLPSSTRPDAWSRTASSSSYSYTHEAPTRHSSLSNMIPVAPLNIHKRTKSSESAESNQTDTNFSSWLSDVVSLDSSLKVSTDGRDSTRQRKIGFRNVEIVEPASPSSLFSWNGEKLPEAGVRDGGYNSAASVQSRPSRNYSSHPASWKDGKAFEKMRNRHNCARELYNTEWQFAQDMAVVVRIFMCSSASIGLSVGEIDTLFSNVSQILDVSLSIVAILESLIPHQILKGDGCIRAPDILADQDLRVGKAMCLALTGQMYEVYENYIHHSDQQMRLYYQLVQRSKSGSRHNMIGKRRVISSSLNDEIKAWLHYCGGRASKFTTAWSLDSLLLKPVQRLGKYPLFLSTLLDNMDPTHEDYPNIVKAHKRSKQYLDCVNARFEIYEPA